MAEYVKFRLATAKIGVLMALLALIAGVADKARAASGPAAKPAASGGLFLKITGLAPTIASDFNKLEKKLLKFDSAISSLDNKVVKLSSTLSKNYYSAQKADRTFLKITDANGTFLKIADAAANAQKLGGLTPDQFLQGKGNVLSNAATATINGPEQQLLGDGSVRVLVSLSPGGAPMVTLTNETSAPLAFTATGASAPSGTIPAANIDGPGHVTLIPSAPQLDIQMFGIGGGGGAGKVWTVTLSNLGTQAGATFVGQMLIGLL